MDQDPQLTAELITKAIEKQSEERTWQLWVSIYPQMGEDNFISFEDFKQDILNSGNDKRSELEILAEAEKIKAADQQRW